MPRQKKQIGNTSDIINFYNVIPKKYLEEVDNPNEHLHDIKIPFRMCIVAPSGSGKTNFLLNLLHKKRALNGESVVAITHEQLANELGTARVVVSRLLKQLEDQGIVKLGRNKIELLS